MSQCGRPTLLAPASGVPGCCWASCSARDRPHCGGLSGLNGQHATVESHLWRSGEQTLSSNEMVAPSCWNILMPPNQILFFDLK